MELHAIIEEIKKERNHIVYIGVGTLAGLKEADGSLLPKNYHQYPPFIQNLKNSYADMSLSILLIDPYQECPPYIVQDKGLVLKEILDNNFIDNSSNDVYSLPDQSITVYTFRQDVYTDPYQTYNNNYLNITTHLRDLNAYAIANDVLFIYHDFTGRNNRLLAEFFDEEIKEHLDHIIYGLGLREDVGCYFDLTDMCSQHPFYRTPQGTLRLFNVYNYIINDKLSLMLNTSMFNNTDIVNSHTKKLLLLIKQELNNSILQTLRTVFRMFIGEEVNGFDIDRNYISCEKYSYYVNLYRDKKYSELYNVLLTDYGKKLDVVACINNLDLTGREILEFITLGDDPFKWHDNVTHFL